VGSQYIEDPQILVKVMEGLFAVMSAIVSLYVKKFLAKFVVSLYYQA
jgi:hypothetical protein